MFKIISLVWLKGKKRRKVLAQLSFDGEELEQKNAEIDLEGDELALKLLEIKLKYGKISDYDYNKEKLTIERQPFFDVKNFKFSEEDPTKGSYELDWNSYFVDYLISHGYKGQDDQDIIAKWFAEWAATVLAEESPLDFNALRN